MQLHPHSDQDFDPVSALSKAINRALGFDSETSLTNALDDCIASEALIPGEQARLKALLDQATDPIEREARAYQIDLVGWQLTRAAEVGRWRKRHLESLKTPAKWSVENQRCGSTELISWADPWGEQRETTGMLYWFAHWAWTYDPRGILKTLPFYLFPFQEATALRIERSVFELQSSLLVDKSRDMGMTWLLACWDVYHWRYTPGFAALLGNRTEDEVDDSEGDMGATFNKLRFQVNLLPDEMLPKRFDRRRHSTFMNLTNPQNGANISGGAPVENFGRGDRRTVIQPDEFASWKDSKGHLQYQACSQTTYSIVITSTVKGVFNKYGELLLDPAMAKHVVDWKDHPWKDERWYAGLKYNYFGPPMSATDIAQEVDRDPYASQPGQVLWMWDEVRHIITHSDFKRVYKTLHDPDPITAAMREQHWNVSSGLDVGTTPEHPNVGSWLMRPREIDPHPDFIFTIREMVRIKWSTRQLAEGLRDEAGRVTEDGIMQFEKRHAITRARIKQRVLSHEGKSELLSFTRDAKEYPLAWYLFEGGKGSPNAGIDQLANALEILPVPHPFVLDPRTYQEGSPQYVDWHYCAICQSKHQGTHVIGCPRMFFLVPDDEAVLFVTEDNKLRRSPALTEAGFPRARYEIPGWHYPESEKGKPVKLRKPEKGEDDFCDSWRMQMAYWGLKAADATEAERIAQTMQARYRPEAIAAAPPEQQADLEYAAYFAHHEAKKELESQQGKPGYKPLNKRFTGRRIF